MFSNVPGQAAVYAFIDGDRLDKAGLRAHVDALADGISRSGMVQGAQLRLVTVTVFSREGGPLSARDARRTAPSTFYAGLRPAAWTVDLRSGKVDAGRIVRPEGVDVLQTALQGNGTLDVESIERMQVAAANRTAAFYSLMKGRQPYVTYGLIAVNVLIFCLLYLNGGPESESTLRDFGALSPQLIGDGQWWRMFTSMFLHASIAHILFNMTSLFAIGTLAERLYGSARYLGIYLGAGLIGSITSFGYAELSGHTDVLGVGASGAIFGVAGALLTVRFQQSDVIPQRLRERVSTSLLPLVAISLLISFLTPHVDNSAHIGGLAGGMLLSFLLPLTRALPGSQA